MILAHTPIGYKHIIFYQAASSTGQPIINGFFFTGNPFKIRHGIWAETSTTFRNAQTHIFFPLFG
jgi:hypothetical protein